MIGWRRVIEETIALMRLEMFHRLNGVRRLVPTRVRAEKKRDKFPVPADEIHLFRQNKLPVPCRTGNRPQRLGIAVKIGAGTRQKEAKWSEISKIPCYFPCSLGIRGVWESPYAAGRPSGHFGKTKYPFLRKQNQCLAQAHDCDAGRDIEI
jgi:hypothetical protein